MCSHTCSPTGLMGAQQVGGGVVHMHHGYADSSFWLCLFNHIPTTCYSFYTNKVGTGKVLSQPSIHMAEGAKATSDNFCKCCRCACPHHDYISNMCSIATLQAARLESSCSMSEAVQQETRSGTLPCPPGCCAPFGPLFLLRVFRAYRSGNRANRRLLYFQMEIPAALAQLFMARDPWAPPASILVIRAAWSLIKQH